MTEILCIDGLPPNVGKGSLLRLLIEQGKVNKNHVGKIVLNGGMATIEITNGRISRLVNTLDGLQVETRHIRAWQQQDSGGNAHFAQLKRWLKQESQAEQQERRREQRREYTLTRLTLRGEDVGLGGLIILRLAPRNEQAQLPWSRLTVGSPIYLSEEIEKEPYRWRGVISRLTRNFVEVALQQTIESDANSFRIDLAADERSRQRMERALMRTESASGRVAALRDCLLGQREAEFSPSRVPSNVDVYTKHLNEAQQEAVRHALAAEDVAIIHGPPGTGKTTTVAALIVTAVSQNQRVLACAPSNLAVDNLGEQLIAAGLKIVRLGHPIRITPQLQSYTLDTLVEQHRDYQQAKKLRKEAHGLRQQAGKFRRARPAKGEKQAMRQEAKSMLNEARQLEAHAVSSVLDSANVTLATLTGIDSALLGQRQFDLCVIDEAGQSTEPATWIPIPRVQRLVLAGDHQQLPPTVLSHQAEKEGFSTSLLQKLMERSGGDLARQLIVQYRMHEQIMRFSSAEFYDDTLQAAPTNQQHTLQQLNDVADLPLTQTPITFIDTAGASYDEAYHKESRSRSNPQEAELVAKKVEQLRQANVPAKAIAVITPYSAQVQLLRESLPTEVEVGSVDGFQGREKEAIIISLVRANEEGEIGFLAETRRMNVALTRARRKLIVIGDSATITAHPFYARLIDYFDSHNAYHSVWEEVSWD